MVQELTKQPVGYQWVLPENVEVPSDELKVRLDFYGQSVVMYVVDKGIITTKMVSAQDVALALLRDIPLGSQAYSPKIRSGGSIDRMERR